MCIWKVSQKDPGELFLSSMRQLEASEISTSTLICEKQKKIEQGNTIVPPDHISLHVIYVLTFVSNVSNT